LNITDSAFDLFIYIIKTELMNHNVHPRLIERVERTCLYYKNCICTQKETNSFAKIYI